MFFTLNKAKVGDQDINKIPVGISGCVMGEQVRFDGGHKRNRFAVEVLGKAFDLQPLCPEMGIGLGVPRATIRQVETDKGIRILGSRDASLDVTDELVTYSRERVDGMAHLCGYIVCGKSPTCGMERVLVYPEGKEQGQKRGVGVFTAELMRRYPWMPVEESGRLQDPVLRENFVQRVYALHAYHQLVQEKLTVDAVQRFHASFKYALMSSDPQSARKLGQEVACLKDVAKLEKPERQDRLQQFMPTYRDRLMQILSVPATRKKHTNTLMHLQGYFKRILNPVEKEEMTGLIHQYRLGESPLMAVIILIRHYLKKYPNHYLLSQSYLQPYPEMLKLRVGF